MQTNNWWMAVKDMMGFFQQTFSQMMKDNWQIIDIEATDEK